MNDYSRTRQDHTRRLVIDAMLAALFVVFSAFLSFKTPIFEVSLVSLPILLCAFLYGTADAVIVAVVGTFFEQLLSAYGLSPTTPLWMLPTVLQALVAGVLFYLLCRRKQGVSASLIAVILIAEVILTVTNTAALYLDGAIMGYSVKALHLLLPARLINGGVRAAISVVAVPLLLFPLKRALGRK